jgi:hypothetical protein
MEASSVKCAEPLDSGMVIFAAMENHTVVSDWMIITAASPTTKVGISGASIWAST